MAGLARAKRLRFNTRHPSCRQRQGAGATTRRQQHHATPAAATRPAPALPSQLVERDGELTRLQESWSATLNGHGRVVLLTGEAGYGKTSLVNAFLALVSASGSGYKVACTSCSAQSGRDEPLWPFSDVMSQLLESKTKEIGEAALDALLELAPSWASVIPVAGDVIGASIRTAQVVRERTRANDMPNPDKLMREYVGALSKVATKQAVLIFIDDLHWSDSASTRLLSHLARHAGNMRVLVLVAYRSSDVAVEGHPLQQTDRRDPAL